MDSQTTTNVSAASSEVSYNSLGNDLAMVQLDLKKDNTFTLRFKSVSPPEGETKPLRLNFEGRYNTEDNWQVLMFEDYNFKAAEVFLPEDARKDEFVVVRDNVVKINSNKETLTLWGIVCEKQ